MAALARVEHRSATRLQADLDAAFALADGILAGDDTGFAQQRSCSAGVQRQYTGTLGRVANC